MNFFQNAAFQLIQKYGYDEKEEAKKLFDQAFFYESNVLSITLLDKFAELSYDMYQILNKKSDHYQLIIKLIIHYLSGNVDKDHYLVKTLSITDYLLKFGCSAIIDDLKNRIHLFKILSEYKPALQDPLYQILRQKANHIARQLSDRKLLYKEKEIAKQIKLKLQLNKQRMLSDESKYKDPNKNDKTIDDLIENYLFKYLDKFNDKLDQWGDQINQKLDAIIEQVATSDSNDTQDYYFPESCMDEIQIVSHQPNADDLKFQSQKVNSNAQIKIEKPKQANLLIFDDEPIPEQKQKQKIEINLLD